MTITVIRLQGDESILLPVWDAIAMDPVIARIGQLWEEQPPSKPYWIWRDWAATLEVARATAWRLFAESNLWFVGTRQYDSSRLVHSHPRFMGERQWDWNLDHPYTLKATRRGRIPLGVVAHFYSKIAMHELPKTVIVDELPASWYWPQRTRAYLVRPGPRPAGKYPGKSMRESGVFGVTRPSHSTEPLLL